MRHLVNHGVADDRRLSPRGHRHTFDRSAKDADTVWEVWLLCAALRERNAFIQTEERSAFRDSLGRWLVLDDELQIADALAELRGELV